MSSAELSEHCLDEIQCWDHQRVVFFSNIQIQPDLPLALPAEVSLFMPAMLQLTDSFLLTCQPFPFVLDSSHSHHYQNHCLKQPEDTLDADSLLQSFFQDWFLLDPSGF